MTTTEPERTATPAERQLLGADPVSPAEIADRLGVQRYLVHRWVQRGAIVPPAIVLSRVPLWAWADVEQWARDTGRLE